MVAPPAAVEKPAKEKKEKKEKKDKKEKKSAAAAAEPDPKGDEVAYWNAMRAKLGLKPLRP